MSRTQWLGDPELAKQIIMTGEEQLPTGETVRRYRHGRVTICAVSSAPSPKGIQAFSNTLHDMIETVVAREVARTSVLAVSAPNEKEPVHLG